MLQESEVRKLDYWVAKKRYNQYIKYKEKQAEEAKKNMKKISSSGYYKR